MRVKTPVSRKSKIPGKANRRGESEKEKQIETKIQRKKRSQKKTENDLALWASSQERHSFSDPFRSEIFARALVLRGPPFRGEGFGFEAWPQSRFSATSFSRRIGSCMPLPQSPRFWDLLQRPPTAGEISAPGPSSHLDPLSGALSSWSACAGPEPRARIFKTNESL